MFCNSLCGPWTKKFGDPWSKQLYLVFTLEGLKTASSKIADLFEKYEQFLYVSFFSEKGLAINFFVILNPFKP